MGEMPGHPGHQIPLVLLGKFHDGGIFLHHSPELFQPFVRLPFNGLIGKDYGAPLGNIGEKLAHLVPLRFGHFEKLHLVHLDKGVLRHHRHALHRVTKLL